MLTGSWRIRRTPSVTINIVNCSSVKVKWINCKQRRVNRVPAVEQLHETNMVLFTNVSAVNESDRNFTDGPL